MGKKRAINGDERCFAFRAGRLAPIEVRNLKLFPAGTEGIHGLNSQAILVVAHR